MPQSDHNSPVPAIQEDLVFGIDLGIASCGWAVINRSQHRIEALGSWCFHKPEEPKTKTPLNQTRREKRLLRRVVRRRRDRMNKVRALFASHGLLPSKEADILGKTGAKLRKASEDELSPWELRVRALTRLLSGEELAVALGHIAKHRGFKSNAKSQGTPPTDEGKEETGRPKPAKTEAKKDDEKVLKSVGKIVRDLEEGKFRTFAELLTRSEEYQQKGRLRNRTGIYDLLPARGQLEDEVRQIFAAQRGLNNPLASEELEKAFLDTAFSQRRLQDSEKLVGYCNFERRCKRAAMRSPSFEEFRLLSKLNHLKLAEYEDDGKTCIGEGELSPDERQRIAAEIGPIKGITYKAIRKLLKLPANIRFVGVNETEEKKDIATSGAKGSLLGTKTLYDALGNDLWGKYAATEKGRKILDDAAFTLSFRSDPERIRKGFEDRHLPGELATPLLRALNDGKFADFTRSAHLSAEACRKIIPYLKQGLVYSEACEKAGYDHAANQLSRREQVLNKTDFKALVKEVGEDIVNPVARKAFTEGLKQLWAMRNRFGLPGAMCIELARAVGKSAGKRGKIEAGIKRTTAERERERKEAAGLLHTTADKISGDTLLRYRLWKEQSSRDIYTDAYISPEKIAANNQDVQVDHILPWSRFGDDSFSNKTLCFVSSNQAKRNQTPMEWFAGSKSPEELDAFRTRVEALPCRNSKECRKRKNFLLSVKDAREKQDGFRTRNLNDTSYAARTFAQCAELLYALPDRHKTKGGTRRVFTRPGQITAALRQAWGVESLKKGEDENGKKSRVEDDRHHALDAVVVACVDEAEIQKLTRSFQAQEECKHRSLRQSPPPWEKEKEKEKEKFRKDVEAALKNVRTARAENPRARGAGHEETIKSLRKDPENQEMKVASRKSLEGLKPAEAQKLLSRLKDPQRNQHIQKAVQEWIDAGCPKETPPALSIRDKKTGEIIRTDTIHKIVVTENDKSGLEIKRGTGPDVQPGLAAAGAMVRVDVFSKPKARGKDAGRRQFYLVPVYTHQVMNKKAFPAPPAKACVANTPEKDWVLMDQNFSFEFSLYPNSYVKAQRKGKEGPENLEGYFAGMGRSTASFSLKNPNNPQDVQASIGALNLLSFQKFAIDRFGEIHPVKPEKRLWHGKICS